MPLLFNFAFSLNTRIQKSWPNRPESYTVNPTQKGTEMFIFLARITCPGLYGNIVNSRTALSSKNEWSLFFFDDLVIFSRLKVSRVDPSPEFPRAAVAALNLTGVSKIVSCYQEKRRSQPHKGRSRLLV